MEKSHYLNPDEIRTLTGYSQPKRQCRWLSDRGYKHERAANGRPIVLRSYADARMTDSQQKPSVHLNFDALKRRR